MKYSVCLLPRFVLSLVVSYPLFVTCTCLMRLTSTCLMLLVFTACTILLAGISLLLPLRNRVVWSQELSEEVLFGQKVVGGRKVIGLNWSELGEGLMAWWRVLQMDEDSNSGDKIVRRPSKEIKRGQGVKIIYSSLFRDSSDWRHWLSCLVIIWNIKSYSPSNEFFPRMQ